MSRRLMWICEPAFVYGIFPRWHILYIFSSERLVSLATWCTVKGKSRSSPISACTISQMIGRRTSSKEACIFAHNLSRMSSNCASVKSRSLFIALQICSVWICNNSQKMSLLEVLRWQVIAKGFGSTLVEVEHGITDRLQLLIRIDMANTYLPYSKWA